MSTAVQKTTTMGMQRYSKDEVLAEYIRQLEQVPLADADGWGILGTILGSETWEDLQSEASKLPKAEDVAGRELKVTNIERHESTIDTSDTPWYFVVESTDIKSGEFVMWQTSARSVMGKLLRLYVHGVLPAIVETRKSLTSTRAGYYPINLIVHAVHSD